MTIIYRRALVSGPRFRTRQLAAASRGLKTLLIPKEDPGRTWERRVAITPEGVKELLEDGDVKVDVERCDRRIFTAEQWKAVGARIVPSITDSDPDVILGIKEPTIKSINNLISKSPSKERTWMVFSHTHKGQHYNMPLLKTFLHEARGQTLVDHELLTDDSGKRVAAFGWYAGAVGAVEGLCTLGHALLKKGISSPLLHLSRPYTNTSLDEMKKSLKRLGKRFEDMPMPKDAGPMVVVITGNGNVANGARDMLEAADAEWVDVEKLPELAKSYDRRKLYACSPPSGSYLVHKNGTKCERKDYYANPHNYISIFDTKVAQYATLLVNGAGWQHGFPRLLSIQQFDALKAGKGGKPLAVVDVSCDLDGGLEFVSQTTTIDKPFYEDQHGTLISSIDILPTQIPLDASKHFASKILPFVKRALKSEPIEAAKSKEDATIQRATIVKSGLLTQKHEKLRDLLPNVESTGTELSTVSGHKQRVLLLGSGLVAGPAVEVFVNRGDVELVIASNNLTEANALAKGRRSVTVTQLDASDEAALAALVAQSDVVVSLLPAFMHVPVARHCIASKKHLVTASYTSPEMAALDEEAKQAGVMLLQECGLDPGIDHMAAMRILSRAKAEGRNVTSMTSWCGGLPEPEASNVPFAYKFSWNPRGVLVAAGNDSQFKLDGQMKEIAGSELLASHFSQVPLFKGLALEGVANRNALPYAEKYGLGPVDGLTSLFRGTLRYKGFSALLDSFRKIGLLQQSGKVEIGRWEDLVPALLSAQMGVDVKSLEGDKLERAIRELVGEAQANETIEALAWLSLLNRPGMGFGSLQAPPPPPSLPPASTRTPIDLLAHLMTTKLAYLPGEQDTVLLSHRFTLAPKTQGEPEQVISASLLAKGSPTASAMSRTVGCTLALAAGRLLDGGVSERGVKGPYSAEVWQGVLSGLSTLGIDVKETGW